MVIVLGIVRLWGFLMVDIGWVIRIVVFLIFHIVINDIEVGVGVHALPGVVEWKVLFFLHK